MKEETITINREDLGYALFGLGRFIDYRLDGGMSREDLVEFMQAYLNLQASIQGREPLDLEVLQSRKVTASPALELANQQVTPRWLPDCEKLKLLHR